MKKFAASIQWAVFMAASSIAAPIAVAGAFGLTGSDASGFVQRTFFVLGAAGLIQALAGHKLPINEGPAGLWWGVFAVYAGLAASLYGTQVETLRMLQGALIASGILFIGLSAAGLIEKISRLFTPAVTGVYLLLLVLQLSKSFLAGMFGISHEGGQADMKIAGLSLATVLITFYAVKSRWPSVRRYGVLLSLAAGWILFAVFGEAPAISAGDSSLVSLPAVFVFGIPSFDSGMILTSVFVTLLLLTNMIASIRVVENLLASLGEEKKAGIKQGGMATGINQLLGGIFSALGSVPISGAAGFISATRITGRGPFIGGSLLILAASLFPAVMSFFAALPVPVGYAVTFAVFTSMIGMALGDLEKAGKPERVRTVAGVALLAGTGIMFIPAAAFSGLPPVLISLLNNGLIFGSVLAVIVDQWTLFLDKRRQKQMN